LQYEYCGMERTGRVTGELRGDRTGERDDDMKAQRGKGKGPSKRARRSALAVARQKQLRRIECTPSTAWRVEGGRGRVAPRQRSWP
jgi:hypothetical protein